MLDIRYQGRDESINLINTENLQLSAYEGLNQPTAEIVSLTNPNIKGTRYQRSAIQDRQISFTFFVYDVENTRYKIMKVFKIGEKGTLHLKNDYREGKIDCYVEEVNFDRFQQLTTLQILLRAPDPYFEGLSEITTELDNITKMFSFKAFITEPVVLGLIESEHKATIINKSDDDLGIEIAIYANGKVVNPYVVNTTTDQTIGVNLVLTEGESLIIDTHKGRKKITWRHNDGRVPENVINKIMVNSEFFSLIRGENILRFGASNGSGVYADCRVRYNNKYEAI